MPSVPQFKTISSLPPQPHLYLQPGSLWDERTVRTHLSLLPIQDNSNDL